jgi:hypothetical protein
MDVHHINGCPLDNRPENLEVLTPEEHGRISAESRWNREPSRGRHQPAGYSQADIRSFGP